MSLRQPIRGDHCGHVTRSPPIIALHSPDVEGVSVVVLGAGGRVPGSGADTVISMWLDPWIRREKKRKEKLGAWVKIQNTRSGIMLQAGIIRHKD